jgi:hypothetical protein
MLGAVARLLGGLEQRDQGPVPLAGVTGQELDRAQQAGHVHVVAAGMGDRYLAAVGPLGGHGARVVHAGIFADGQRVQFGPEQDGRPGAVGQDAHHTRAADAGLDGEAVLAQFPGDALGGAVLLVRQLGMTVQVLVERFLAGLQARIAGQDLRQAVHRRSAEPPEKIVRKNRKTFRMSRKIEAASSGAELMSVLRRSRWKSNMVNPAKMTRPMME